MDLIFTPICSIARALGLYSLADRLFRLGPHKIATELGACGYYYDNSTEARAHRKELENKRRRQEDAQAKLEAAGYVAEMTTERGTSIRHPWVWSAPHGHRPTKTELEWIATSGHYLKLKDDPTMEYERLDK